MILECANCEQAYVSEGWICGDCAMPTGKPGVPVRDLTMTPVLANVLDLTDLHMAIAAALPLMRNGYVAEAITTLERVHQGKLLRGGSLQRGKLR